MASSGTPTVTPALLARSGVNYGETDKVCTLLTRDLGKLSAMARGARRSRRRFGGALGLFIVGEATLRRGRPGRGGQLWSLERFDSREDLARAIGGDVVKLAHASYILEVARELWPEAQCEPQLFDHVVGALRVLASLAEPSPSLLRAYELQLLVLAGFAPALEHCATCGDIVQRDATELGFSIAQGGVICGQCGPHGWPLQTAVLQELVGRLRCSLAEAASATPDRETARAMRDVMLMVIRHHIGKDLRSLEFIVKLAGA